MKKELHTKVIFCVLICLAVGAIGSIATSSSVEGWYVTLNKPSFNPPNWIFGPVWTILFILMGIATGIVWFKKPKSMFAGFALKIFAAQLVLNVLWSFSFFYFQSPLLGLINIIILLFLIVMTIKWYSRVDKLASYLLYPYIAWVSFATVLNFNIWVLN
ncbi:MAG: tryptophan-rich sensory protein [Flavobacteriaceae bacterium]|nr:tryptophan-rich sensory protein [Flavobacteriaceae bacterium]